MRGRVLGAALATCAALVVPGAALPQGALPTSTLWVWSDARLQQWWRAEHAPARWSAAHPALTAATTWTAVASGVEWAEVRLAAGAGARQHELVAVRIDPTRVRLRLARALTDDGRRGLWTVDKAPAEALVALNAGHFVRGSPWGWLVVDGVEQLSPGRGPLTLALSVDARGQIRWHGDAALRDTVRTDAAQAFQSYPTLLVGDGTIPEPLRAVDRGIDLSHRDARLAIGQLRDGRLLVVLTRYESMAGALGAALFGLTIPELAAVMGGLGCHTAVALDGGTSAQLAVRPPGGPPRAWRGMRRVPVGLLVLPR